MSRTWRVFSFLSLLYLLTPGLLQAQRPGSGGHATGGVIDVRVRYPNGTPGPRGLHIRLESAEGGASDDTVTQDGGKCQFNPTVSGVYFVRLTEPQYKPVTERVELIGITRGYVTIELKPLKNEREDDVIIDSSASARKVISAADLGVPENALQEYDKGEAALRAKDPAQAVKYFEKATKLYGNYPEAFHMLGEAYLEQQDWKNAQAALRRSVQLDPKSSTTYVDLGAVENQQRNYLAAEEALKKGLDLSPDASSAKYELAKTYWAMGRWDDAAPLAKDAVAGLPELATARVLFGNILLKKRDGAGALREFKEYLRLEPAGSMAPQVRDIVAKLENNLPK